MSGERVVEAWHAAMETALLCTSVNRRITPDRGGRKRGEEGGERVSFI